jgi:hypothetical protein
VRSLPQIAPEVQRVALQRRKAVRQQVEGGHRRSLVEAEVLRRMHTRLRVQAGSDAPDVAGAVLQDRVASADYSGSTMAAEG